VLAGSFVFSHSASANSFEWPTVTVNKHGDISGDFIFIPDFESYYWVGEYTLNPGDTEVFDVPVFFWVGEKDNRPIVDITIAASGDFVFGGFETRNVLGFEYAGYGGLCYGDCVVDFTNTVVPLPAAAWLFGSGLIGLAGIKRRQKAKA
jgi:hypothetical protein